MLGERGGDFGLLSFIYDDGVDVSPQGSHSWTSHYKLSLEDPDSHCKSWVCVDFVSVGYVLTVNYLRLVGVFHGLQSWLQYIDPSCPSRSLKEIFFVPLIIWVGSLGVWVHYYGLSISGAEFN